MSEPSAVPGAAPEAVPTPPEAVVASIQQLAPGARRLVLLTGSRGAGKTTWCESLVAAARAHGLSVGGLLSPPVWAPDEADADAVADADTGLPGRRAKARIDLLDLASGERRVLAVPAVPGPASHGLGWRFDAEAVAWGNGVLGALRHGWAAGERRQVTVIDELGPLEFVHGRGLTAGLALIDGGCYRVAVVVVRPKLVQTACARWPEAVVLTPPEWRST